MSIPILETCRKRKRRPKLFGLHTFAEPGSGCPAVNTTGCPFRDNIRAFLKQCAEPEDYCVKGMPIWCTLLSHDKTSVVIPLYTIKEDVNTDSPNPFCDHCRCTGLPLHFFLFLFLFLFRNLVFFFSFKDSCFWFTKIRVTR